MSITVSTDVFCDACGNWVHGLTGPRVEVREARRLAKALDWVYRDGLDLCPECAAP